MTLIIISSSVLYCENSHTLEILHGKLYRYHC
ncbi:hypothetical protein VP511E551_P0049 [Vibrio phage 511E55-1]|nr:hypothetical protein VP511E551_P0049 [Vibrio phage 511E55-1]